MIFDTMYLLNIRTYYFDKFINIIFFSVMWFWNLVSDPKGRKWIEGVWQHITEENICNGKEVTGGLRKWHDEEFTVLALLHALLRDHLKEIR